MASPHLLPLPQYLMEKSHRIYASFWTLHFFTIYCLALLFVLIMIYHFFSFLLQMEGSVGMELFDSVVERSETVPMYFSLLARYKFQKKLPH